ncbi:NAD(P)/FAD-dependent oxidoreductase [Phyllobacterium sp. 0TCS1.6C]|uniref:NAD(P)-binding domain-containing protein n=1 Tax=unclassified Phyllobacterium TaxID=2638441 RepID=UPI002264F762|nr:MULTISPECIES: NAD(P)/FAD-dependent oxidoreductase [unclassified Phyllobacterium]MCX8280012.1 NAD(P)/FAD-dependent oxidoreductase [Phyllobacterium sp. 0TCS1.6C]MCX8296179.1 NAD(P)/FAD-dependent oxidoreductase [Phyllobacterium sp. 0TCS1.6A]
MLKQDATGLDALNARVREDLEYLNYPPANWVPVKSDAAGNRAADVTIIGAGMCGLVAAFALYNAGISNVRILDRNPAGREGPWMTYGRMETLRSPKQLVGPAYGMASLTFRAWFTAQFGRAEWDALFRIPRPMWMDYLRWYRDVLNLPVENDVDVTRIRPQEDGLFELEVAGGAKPAIMTRKVVLAMGREGLGRPTIPAFMSSLPRHAWSHSSDMIDFASLAGKRVIVVGVGASAVDNAAEALEHGAKEVRLLARRKSMPTINKLMGIGSYGVTAGFAEISPEWRWRIMDYSFKQQTPAPHNSTLRVSRHDNAFFHFDCAIETVAIEGDELLVRTVNGREFRTDHIILGTGFTVDTFSRRELEPYAQEISTWADHYTPPADEANADLARFPWLNRDFSFTEKAPGRAPWLKDIHCFNYGATLSIGKVSGDIPAISEGGQWLAQGIAAGVFIEDIDVHWRNLLAYEKPELDGSEWTDADAPSDGPDEARRTYAGGRNGK